VRLSARFAALRVRVADGPTQRIGDLGKPHASFAECFMQPSRLPGYRRCIATRIRNTTTGRVTNPAARHRSGEWIG